MAEDDRTVETSVDRTTTDDADREHRDADEATIGPDSAADAFFELDEELDRSTDVTSGGVRRGLVVDANRVEIGSVPTEYPLSATTDQAVALTVDFGDDTSTVYLAWPDDTSGDTALTWLLDAMGIELRDLYGTAVLVERDEGHDVLVTPDERPRGSDLQAGLVAGLGVATGTVGLIAVTGTGAFSVVASLLWVAVTLGWLPYAAYRDAWYARTHSDWAGGPVFWATLMFLPFLNLVVGVIYLWSRSQATFFHDQPSLFSEVTSTVRNWL